MLLGAVVLATALQWQSARWLDSARRIARNSSVHVINATPMAGLLMACLGLSIIWPPAIVLVFLAAGAFLSCCWPHRIAVVPGRISRSCP